MKCSVVPWPHERLLVGGLLSLDLSPILRQGLSHGMMSGVVEALFCYACTFGDQIGSASPLAVLAGRAVGIVDGFPQPPELHMTSNNCCGYNNLGYSRPTITWSIKRHNLTVSQDFAAQIKSTHIEPKRTILITCIHHVEKRDGFFQEGLSEHEQSRMRQANRRGIRPDNQPILYL